MVRVKHYRIGVTVQSYLQIAAFQEEQKSKTNKGIFRKVIPPHSNICRKVKFNVDFIECVL